MTCDGQLTPIFLSVLSTRDFVIQRKMVALFLVLWLSLGPAVQASFKIYDHYESSIIQVAYGLSTECLRALSEHNPIPPWWKSSWWGKRNSTISCDKNTGSNAAGGPDSICKSLKPQFASFSSVYTLLMQHTRLVTTKCYDSLYQRMRGIPPILELSGCK